MTALVTVCRAGTTARCPAVIQQHLAPATLPTAALLPVPHLCQTEQCAQQDVGWRSSSASTVPDWTPWLHSTGSSQNHRQGFRGYSSCVSRIGPTVVVQTRRAVPESCRHTLMSKELCSPADRHTFKRCHSSSSCCCIYCKPTCGSIIGQGYMHTYTHASLGGSICACCRLQSRLHCAWLEQRPPSQ